MTNPMTTLRDDVAALKAQVGALRRELVREQRRMRGARHGRLLTAVAVALLVALVPLSILAAGPFGDLDPAQAGPTGHNPNIQAIADAGITRGCGPTAYCPKDFVTREEMASFLARTAGLGGNPPVANARTIGGYPPSGLVRAFAASNSDNATGGEVPVGQSTEVLVVPFTAPSPGFVLVTGSQSVMSNGAGCPCRVGLQVRHRDATNTPRGESPVMVQGLGTDDRQTGTVSTVIEVGAGPQTFVLYAYRTDGSATIKSRPALTGLFVPFGPTGATP